MVTLNNKYEIYYMWYTLGSGGVGKLIDYLKPKLIIPNILFCIQKI